VATHFRCMLPPGEHSGSLKGRTRPGVPGPPAGRGNSHNRGRALLLRHGRG
jgi:hypothetical protein